MKTIGILGGGQLAKMLVESFIRYDFNFRILSKEENSPTSKIVSDVVTGDWDSEETLREFASGCNVITLENEFIDFNKIKFLESLNIPVSPSSNVVRLIQDKFIQKQTLSELGIPVASFVRIDSKEELKEFAREKTYPVILKSRTMGYDGKGNYRINSESDIDHAFELLSGRGELLVEEYVGFLMELAIQVTRNSDGEIVMYPIVETVQQNHICHIVKACRDRFTNLKPTLHEYCEKILNGLNYVGTIGIELFLLPDGSVVVNELAPRVHNSGHYTIEGCETSQFENHLRAVCGLPLGDSTMIYNTAVMINVLGERSGEAQLNGLESMLQLDKTYLHLYRKFETRIGRKMGHITVLGSNLETCLEKAVQARELISI